MLEGFPVADAPYSEVVSAYRMGEQSWLYVPGLVHLHYNAGLQTWSMEHQYTRETYPFSFFARLTCDTILIRV
ncbi:hypothetical protein F5Y08DRAFT_323736 [Xylaria arbuscula]|nr:hypothetical protein F5Y08DRAFT_323736 [Xylaria arbuscula]